MRLAKIGHLAAASALAIVMTVAAAPASAQTEVCIESTSALYQAIADGDRQRAAACAEAHLRASAKRLKLDLPAME